MPVGIPRVPLFRKGDKKDRDSKYRDMYKKFHLFGLEKERDPESDNERDAEPDNERAYREYMRKFAEDDQRDRDLNERDREADYERERAYSEFISRFEDDQDGGEEAIKEEDKQKEKKEEEEEEKRKKEAVPLVDLFTRMYFERVLFLFGEIDDEKASKLMAILHYYSLADPTKRFLLIINSPGGGLAPGIALYDALQWATPGVDTLCVGIAYSMASFVLSGGYNENRAAAANSRIMLHEPRVKIAPKTEWDELCFDMTQIKLMTTTVIEQLAKRTGKSEDTVRKDLKSYKFMSPEEAQIHGIIDSIADKDNDLFGRVKYSRGFQRNT